MNAQRSPAAVLQLPFAPNRSGVLRRKCACGTHKPGGGECRDCAKKRLQRRPGGSMAAPGVPPIVHEVLRSPGQAFDPAARRFFEHGFGHDFSRVRIHADERAAESAQAVGAQAYTIGRDVVFGAGRYAPATAEGHKLLAHELVHVMQQRRTAEVPPGGLQVGSADDAHEREADRLSESVLTARTRVPVEPAAAGPSLQRACGPAAIRSIGGCVGVGGQDITDVGSSSADLFQFRVSCDEFLAGEEARLLARARAMAPGDAVDIHGFASEEGDARFNEDLSCARAIAARRIVQRESPLTQVALFKHGATAGVHDYRRAVVLSVRSAVRAPEDCSHLVGDCEFYLCRERRHPCGAAGYYRGYGYKYCDRFTRLLRPRLSRAGQRWVDQTRLCLMEYVDRHIPLDAPCDRVKRSAFDSHPRCYVVGGICFLDPGEWREIVSIIDSSDMELRQTILTGIDCLANWGALVIPGSLGAGGGLRGLMERDRRRTFGF
ncbi:MAG: DUF4157 domain-containing protein [Xanthomonadaceae bacterium]|nr:DUF4157 domain-containing protein [Xanthomonadaceae bacterium]